MTGTPRRVYAARLAGTPVHDPSGDEVGKVRDIVAAMPITTRPPRAVGLVVDVAAWRQIFVPLTRVTAFDPGQVMVTGLLNVRRFAQRPSETLVIAELLDRTVTLRSTGERVTVFDVAMEQNRTLDWLLTKLAVLKGQRRFRRRGDPVIVDWSEVSGLAHPQAEQEATRLLETLGNRKPADLAGVLHDLSPKRRVEVAAALDDEQLAEVLGELPEADQVQILTALDLDRATDVVSEMAPDDAADLLGNLPKAVSEQLLDLMTPKGAGDVRRLLTYEEDTAGGLMTSDPVVLPPDGTVAEALARLRIHEVTPALSTMAYVCRPPLETPTGRFLGVAHLQRLLREPPSTLVSGALDTGLEPLRPETPLRDVARYLAAYNLVAAPVVDAAGRLVGAVAVDDVLDHLLPKDWRQQFAEVTRES